MTTPMLTCEALDVLLPEYLEGSLDDTMRAAADAHLRTCTPCANLVHDLQAIEHQARALPDLSPTRDLWSGIEARLEPAVVPLATRAAAPNRRRFTPRLTTGWLAAAAALLMAATAGITYQVTKNELASRAGTRPIALAPAGNPALRTVANSPVEATYDHEIAELRATLEARRSELDPTTVAVIERNLRVIDTAIAESRAALAADPGSQFLHDQLNMALGQKVELLRTAALLPSRT